MVAVISKITAIKKTWGARWVMACLPERIADDAEGLDYCFHNGIFRILPLRGLSFRQP
jgi:hypothetical protein